MFEDASLVAGVVPKRTELSWSAKSVVSLASSLLIVLALTI
jgi:hypothetical protein